MRVPQKDNGCTTLDQGSGEVPYGFPTDSGQSELDVAALTAEWHRDPAGLRADVLDWHGLPKAKRDAILVISVELRWPKDSVID
jgi:hypothetical protein